MGRQIIKQNDSTYAVFSSVVGAIVRYDMSKQELINHFRQEAADRAERLVLDSLKRGLPSPLALTWDQAVKMHNIRYPDDRIEP